MKNLKKVQLTMLGVLALVAAVTLNVRHALNDYGVKDNKLHVEVLAQSNNSGGGSTGSGSYTQGISGTNWKEYSIQCTVSKSTTVTVNAGASIGVSYGGVGVSFSSPSVSISTTTTSAPTTITKNVCGYGSGSCWVPASRC